MNYLSDKERLSTLGEDMRRIELSLIEEERTDGTCCQYCWGSTNDCDCN